MSYVDAHLHLADPGYDGQVDSVLNDAGTNWVAHLLSNGMNYESSLHTLNLSKQYPKVIPAVGIHLWTVTNANTQLQLNAFERFVEENRKQVKAIGEIGLDGKYPQDTAQKRRQREVFQFMLSIAEHQRLPVTIHPRLAIDEILLTLPSFRLVKVLLHWYSGAAENLRMIIERAYLISVGPSILYSKRAADVARQADLSIIVTETDGPVTYNGPFKGKPTRPSFVIDVVRRLSEMKNKSVEEIRDTVWGNFHSLISPTR